MVKLVVTCELFAFSGLHVSSSLYRSKQGLLHLKNSEWFVPCSGVGPQLCNPDLARGTFPRQNVPNTLRSDHCWKFGRAQRLPPRRIADDHDGGLCFEPVVVVVVVAVVVVHGCCGCCGWCWCWCWWFWCREGRQPLKKKKAGGGLGGRAQRLPPRCIADDHDGGLCFEPVVVPASGCFQVPPPPDDVLLHSLLERRCSCCCCRCSGGGPPKKTSCCSLLLWILWMVLVLVVLVP